MVQDLDWNCHKCTSHLRWVFFCFFSMKPFKMVWLKEKGKNEWVTVIQHRARAVKA